MAKIDPLNSSIDGDINGEGIDEDGEFDILSNILDFPIESLGGEDELAEDWDVSKFQSLGPIPTELLEPSLGPIDKISRPKQPAESRHAGANPHSHQSPVSVLCPSQIRKAARSKRAKPARNPWLSALPVVIAALAYKKICSRVSKKEPSSSSSSSSKRAKNSNQPPSSSAGPNGGAKACSHCQSTETPQWREGPLGPQTLCNACGVRFRTGRLFPEYRPASSPTFVSSVHSNCHKKVMEMRNRAREMD